MESQLQVDYYAVNTPNAPDGMIVRALLTLSGQVPAGLTRAPFGLSLVIDNSGSMGGDRIEAARDAAAHVIERLHPDDVVSVVTFDSEVRVIAPPERRAAQHGLLEAVRQIDVAGSTNLSGGWLRGRQHMEAAAALVGRLPGSTRRLVLLTDGHANTGITDPATLTELARTARMLGITTTTVGIGEGYDDDLLRRMADAGGGNAWYVERPDQAHDVLGQELGQLLSVAAQGTTVSLALGEAVSVVAVHSSWPVTSRVPGVLEFDLGDLYAAEPKPLLVEVFVPRSTLGAATAGESGLPTAVATLTVSADVITLGGVEHRTMHLPIAASFDAQSLVVPEIERAVLLARTAQAREEAARRQREGDALGAAHAMREASQAILASPLVEDAAFAPELEGQRQDLEILAEQYHRCEFSELDAKYQMQRSYNARRGKKGYDEALTRRRE